MRGVTIYLARIQQEGQNRAREGLRMEEFAFSLLAQRMLLVVAACEA